MSAAGRRVMAVADALAPLPFFRTGLLNRRRVAAVAVAALDEYEEAGRIPVPESGRDLADSLRAAWEADLRERIAREIEDQRSVPCPDFDRSCACAVCYETHALNDAARIARGQV